MRAALLLVLLVAELLSPRSGVAQNLPPGFQQTQVWSGFANPTLIRFAPDGRVFVGEYGGRIYVLDGLADPTPTLFADLRANVFAGWDRGMLGLAVHPQFPAQPYVYVLYAYDAPPGQVAPYWNDVCPTPPGYTTDGCVVTGRLSRLEMGAGGTMVGAEQVLIGTGSPAGSSQWCQQFPSHSIGDLAFGGDGMLYVSAGDGASFNNADWGQFGGSAGSPTPKNPCGDPPSGVGGTQTSPSAEGGALRSQDLIHPGDPTSFDGTILRLDPLTGAAAPGNPLVGGSAGDDDRVIAFGLRNPFRITAEPGTNRIFVGDVGWNTWEEVDVVENGADAVVENFGWPCYEGASGSQSQVSGYSGLTMCSDLYAAGGSASPGNAKPSLYAYHHSAKVVPGEVCGTGGSSIAGVAYYSATHYPAEYHGALFFQDATRRCIWAMKPGANGRPSPTNLASFWANPALRPVDLTLGPDGKLYFADFNGGGIYRIDYFAANTPPIARFTASPSSGNAPLVVQFDASSSSDPDGDNLVFAWDLDGDGVFDDSSQVNPSFTYTLGGSYGVQLRVTDDGSPAQSDTEQQTISVNNLPPVAEIVSPAPPPAYAVGDVIGFSGTVTDPEDGILPASRYTWTLEQFHCSHTDPSDCHGHLIQSWSGITGGSFTAPDHGYPSYLLLTLSGTDFGIGGVGALSDSTSLEIHPATAAISIDSSPSGLEFSLGDVTENTPSTLEVIVNSQTTLSTPSPQTLAGQLYQWSAWSNGGARTQTLNPQGPESYLATFVAALCDGDGACESGEDCNGCPSDCPATPAPSCGDGACNAGDGEDCLSCPQDCNGQQTGKPSQRFCCGDGAGTGPVSCSDARCSTNGWICLAQPAPATCCGDLVCAGSELSICPLDCPRPACGDGTCNGLETRCNCAADCGAPPSSETPSQTCSNAADDDCDGAVDCGDADCSSDPICSCLVTGSSCSSHGQCCSGHCRRGACR